MKIIEAIELQEIDVPIDNIIAPDGSFDIQENVRKYFDIDYKPKSDKLSLVAGGRIGLIPLNSRLAVNIKPKFPVSNLIYIVGRSGDELTSLDFFQRGYEEISEGSKNFFLFFAKSLAKELEKLSTEGVYKNYSSTSENTSFPKGRINFRQTVLKNWSRGSYSKVFIDRYEFTADNPLNRLIKFTIWFCLNQLSRDYSDETELSKTLYQYSELLESVPLDASGSFNDSVDELLAYDKIPTLRNYYVNIAKLCRFIVSNMSISLSKQGDDLSMLSFCVDMSAVFEKYILNVLRANTNLIGTDVSVLDGNFDGQQSLFLDRSKPEAKPDFIIKLGRVNRVLVDAKYKPRLKEVDRYQIIAHALCFSVHTAVLLCPRASGRPSGLQYCGTIGDQYQLKIYEYYFDMGNDDLKWEEESFLSVLSDLA